MTVVTIWSSNPTPSHTYRQSYNLKRYMQCSKRMCAYQLHIWQVTFTLTSEISNIVVLPVEMLNDTDSFSFVMWMKYGAQQWFLQKTYILVPTHRWAPIQWWKTLHVSDLCLLRDQPWAGLNLTKFCLHGRFRPKSCPHWCCLDETTCFPQWEHLDLTLYSAH